MTNLILEMKSYSIQKIERRTMLYFFLYLLYKFGVFHLAIIIIISFYVIANKYTLAVL